MGWLLIPLLVLALLSIPFGLPGLWIMLAIVIAGTVLGQINIIICLICIVVAIIAQLIEFLIVKRMTTQYGGSRKAFWGAMGGGLVGVIVGAPIPVIGSIIAGMIGSFVGAALVTYAETKELGAAHRVGFGAMVGRAFAAVAKTGAGLTILVLAAAAFLR